MDRSVYSWGQRVWLFAPWAWGEVLDLVFSAVREEGRSVSLHPGSWILGWQQGLGPRPLQGWEWGGSLALGLPSSLPSSPGAGAGRGRGLQRLPHRSRVKPASSSTPPHSHLSSPGSGRSSNKSISCLRLKTLPFRQLPVPRYSSGLKARGTARIRHRVLAPSQRLHWTGCKAPLGPIARHLSHLRTYKHTHTLSPANSSSQSLKNWLHALGLKRVNYMEI